MPSDVNCCTGKRRVGYAYLPASLDHWKMLLVQTVGLIILETVFDET
jgi:hypothetical protein